MAVSEEAPASGVWRSADLRRRFAEQSKKSADIDEALPGAVGEVHGPSKALHAAVGEVHGHRRGAPRSGWEGPRTFGCDPRSGWAGLRTFDCAPGSVRGGPRDVNNRPRRALRALRMTLDRLGRAVVVRRARLRRPYEAPHSSEPARARFIRATIAAEDGFPDDASQATARAGSSRPSMPRSRLRGGSSRTAIRRTSTRARGSRSASSR
jgi:hypothetical protein